MTKIARAALWLALLAQAGPVAAQTVVASQADIKAFLGGEGGLLFFIDNADGAKLKYVDINDSSLTIKTLDGDACNNPRISLDGTRVAYGVNDTTAVTYKIYTRNISGGARVEIASVGTAKSKGVGYWYSSGGSDYIVYCTSTEKYGYDTGKTYKQKIKNGIERDGAPVEIYNKAYDGGITPDGTWIGEAYGERHAYNLTTSKEYADFYKVDSSKEGQCCNASMAPMTGPYRMVTLVLPHDYFRSWQYDSAQDRWQEYKTYTKPSGTVEWQTPEWSLHKDYITVTADEGGYDLYIQNANDPSKRIKVIDGNIGTSHLYVGSTGGPACGVDVDCDDGDVCTTDSCDGGGCTNASISGCCNQASECDDGDACTNDTCDNNSCTNASISGCCKADAECDDGDICTADSCSSNTCSYEAVASCCTKDSDCGDGDACTADSCNLADNSCQHVAVSGCCTNDGQCDDGTTCTQDSCDTASNSCSYDPIAGCCSSDADCADSNPCTTDSCDQSSGNCSNVAVDGCCAFDTDCEDSDICTADSCGADSSCAHAPLTGCCSSVADCEDGDPCTTDSCDGNGCSNKPIAGCCSADVDCDDGDACTTDSCDGNTCTATAISGCCTEDSQCDDGTDCTANSCGADNACAFTPLSGCCKSDADCADTNPCTEDRCVSATGECEYASVGGCCTVDTDCSDGDDCTVDSCDLASSSCSHEPLTGCTAPVSDSGALGADSERLVGGCSIGVGSTTLPALLLLALLLLLDGRRGGRRPPR